MNNFVNEEGNSSDLSRGCPNAYHADVTDVCTGEVKERKFPCKTRGCPVCGPWLRRCHVAHTLRCLSEEPRLSFLTLSLEPSYYEEVPPRSYWPDLLRRTRALLFKRLRRRAELTYFWVFEWPPGGIPHYHYLLSAEPTRESVPFLETVKAQFEECGHGSSLWIDPIQTKADLETFAGYAYKNTFTRPELTGRDRGVTQACGASEGLGYMSEKQVCRRKRIARQQAEDPFVLTRDAKEAVEDALRRSVGKPVQLPDGRVGRLLDWSPGRAEVEVGDEVVVTAGHKPAPIDGKTPPIREVTPEVEPVSVSPSTESRPRAEAELEKESREKAVRTWASRGRQMDFRVRYSSKDGE